ncbi:hypothetical protein EWH23_04020 [Meiothermus sp. PNK-Is4]|nr:hypothetical protein DNA98_05665 [Meiothermus sp. Pnk-1]RYM39020.1 hypothetical protein EWH23_04020 [Meiothermus sp. PNK-Is4]
MRVGLRWAFVYLGLLALLLAIGHWNQAQRLGLETLEQREQALKTQETRLLLQRYARMSPLELRKWAEENGYIPMSLGQWIKQGGKP